MPHTSVRSGRRAPAKPRCIGLLGALTFFCGGLPSNLAAPANDDFATAAVLSGSADSDSASNSGAGKETNEPAHAGDIGGLSVWWKWTAPGDGLLTASTAGSLTEFSGPMDTVLAVYTGSSVDNLTEIASSDQDLTGSGPSQALVFVSSGTTYHIAADSSASFGDPTAGTIILSLSLDASGANDHLANRKIASGAHDSFLWTNRNASREAGEATHGGTGGASVWWEWTSPFDGPVTFTTESDDAQIPESGSLDTLMAVYEGTGSSHASLSLIANDDDSGSNLSSLVTFTAESGKKYFIAVEGKNGPVGEFHFCYSQGLPATIDVIERMGDGSTRLTITTPAACRLRIETNQDLVNPAAWTRAPNGRLNNKAGTFQFTDNSSIGKNIIFYRISTP